VCVCVTISARTRRQKRHTVHTTSCLSASVCPLPPRPPPPPRPPDRYADYDGYRVNSHLRRVKKSPRQNAHARRSLHVSVARDISISRPFCTPARPARRLGPILYRTENIKKTFFFLFFHPPLSLSLSLSPRFTRRTGRNVDGQRR